jgi:uncharacterized peroxidase-related enzyme
MRLEKPYIKLDSDFPGIISLFMFDRQVAAPMSDLAEVLLRRPSSLSIGERELIASFVSKLNGCKFCCGSHTECTKEFLDPEVVDAFLTDEDSEVLSLRLRGLMVVALDVQELNREALPEDILKAKMLGASDQEIHDTVAIAAAFCMYNRYVDGLGTVYKDGDLYKSGVSIARYGYLMGVKRFFNEVVPQMWARIWK